MGIMRSAVGANPGKGEDFSEGHREASSAKSYYPMSHVTTKYAFFDALPAGKDAETIRRRGPASWFSEPEFTAWVKEKTYTGHISEGTRSEAVAGHRIAVVTSPTTARPPSHTGSENPQYALGRCPVTP
jgi:hypothetical protein